ADVDVASIELNPVFVGEVVGDHQVGRQPDGRVAVVERGGRLAVPGGDEECAVSIHGRPGRRPDPGLASGGDLVAEQIAAPVEGRRHYRALVGPTVAEESAERDVDAPTGDRQRAALLLDARIE